MPNHPTTRRELRLIESANEFDRLSWRTELPASQRREYHARAVKLRAQVARWQNSRAGRNNA